MSKKTLLPDAGAGNPAVTSKEIHGNPLLSTGNHEATSCQSQHICPTLRQGKGGVQLPILSASV